MLGPSAYVDSRAPDEDSGDDGEHTDDNFESAKDPRRTTISGPPIAALDSLESQPDESSDDSFFNFDDLDHAEVQEEIIDDGQHFGNRTANPYTQIDDSSTSAQLSELPMPLRRCGETIESSDIDSDGDVIPEADFSSTDDETSTNARIRRNSEKRRICR